MLKTSVISKTTLFLAAGMISVSTMADMSAMDFDQTQRLANKGLPSYQTELGLMYDRGEGVRQDYAQAKQWYQKAAEQGHADAQFNLGVMYYTGKGVRQDYAQAKEWFGKSCDNGDQNGCNNYRKLNQR